MGLHRLDRKAIAGHHGTCRLRRVQDHDLVEARSIEAFHDPCVEAGAIDEVDAGYLVLGRNQRLEQQLDRFGMMLQGGQLEVQRDRGAARIGIGVAEARGALRVERLRGIEPIQCDVAGLQDAVECHFQAVDAGYCKQDGGGNQRVEGDPGRSQSCPVDVEPARHQPCRGDCTDAEGEGVVVAREQQQAPVQQEGVDQGHGQPGFE